MFLGGGCVFKPLAQHLSGFKAYFARRELRRRLHRLGIDGANQYWLRDFRRGHAQDVVDGGGRLGEVLLAGEWSSPPFHKVP